MDRLDAMRSFVSVVECEGFTAAARALGRHKTTLSQQVAQLEAALGVRLLVRTTRSVVPTAEGLAYHRRAAGILQQVEEAEAMLKTGAGTASGPLRVQVPVVVGRSVLVPEIRAFLDRHPRIALELGCTDRRVDLVREGVDCALRGGDLPDSTLVARRIGHVRFVLCAAPAYADAYGLPATPQQLADHRRIGCLPGSGRRLPDVVLERGASRVSIAMPSRFMTTDSGALLTAGLDGLGIVQVSDHVAAPYVASGGLLPVLPAWRCPSLPLHFVMPAGRQRSARVRAFIDWAHAVLVRRGVVTASGT